MSRQIVGHGETCQMLPLPEQALLKIQAKRCNQIYSIGLDLYLKPENFYREQRF